MSESSGAANRPTMLAAGRADRRRFLGRAAFASLGIVGAQHLMAPGVARAAGGSEPPALTDADILNFALNLEYLEAEYYLRGVFGRGLDQNNITGEGLQGEVLGGSQVPFETPAIRQYAREIALDEAAHVRFLRSALGDAAVARPTIDLRDSFTAAAQAAGLIGSGETFDPFADEDSFLLGAFIFEDVGVTAYKGAAPLIEDRGILEAAAGILAVEAYHASNLRTVLFQRGLIRETQAISDARDALDGPEDLDQGIALGGKANIVPSDRNGIAFSRTPDVPVHSFETPG